METTIKTPVEIVQELLALYSTRKESVEKLKATQPADATAAKLTAADQQSDQFISEWMNELNNYGDAVMASVDRENGYQELWKNKLGTIASLSPQEVAQTFEEMESSLKKIYQDTLKSNPDLPLSITEILSKQLSKL